MPAAHVSGRHTPLLCLLSGVAVRTNASTSRPIPTTVQTTLGSVAGSEGRAMSLILVGVDMSDASTRAVEFASTRAKQLGCELLLVHIIPWSPYSFSTPGENERRSQTRQAEIDAATTQIIEPRVKTVSDAGIPVDSIVRHGDPVDLLNDIVAERDIIQVVVGRTGDTRVKRALFGSIPGHLTRTATVPVTVVP